MEEFKMKIIIKQLQGGECSLDVFRHTYIYEIKRRLEDKLNIPMEEQKLLYRGRNLIDNLDFNAYPEIQDGTKLNLIVKKPEEFYEITVRHFKRMGMGSSEASYAASRLSRNMHDKLQKLSWDDIDRLSLDCLLDDNGEKPPVGTRSEPEGDEVYIA